MPPSRMNSLCAYDKIKCSWRGLLESYSLLRASRSPMMSILVSIWTMASLHFSLDCWPSSFLSCDTAAPTRPYLSTISPLISLPQKSMSASWALKNYSAVKLKSSLPSGHELSRLFPEPCSHRVLNLSLVFLYLPYVNSKAILLPRC